MTTQSKKTKDVDDDFGDVPPAPPPAKRMFKLGMGGDMGKIVLVSCAVVIAILALLSVTGGGGFVTKKDFTTNMVNVNATLEAARTGLAQARTDVANALQGIPATISNEISNRLQNYATTSQLQSYATTSQLQNYATTSQLQNYATTSEVDRLEGRVTDLEVLVGKYEKRIEDLEKKLATTSVSVPSISSFTPTSGIAGTSVSITGTNFIGATAVSFGGISAQNFIVNSSTSITAVVANGATGAVTVTTPNGTATSSATFTYGSGGSTVSGVSTTFSPSTIIALPNAVNISIANNSGKDIFGGQFSLSLQYLDAIPSSTNMAGLSSAEVVWGASGSIAGTTLTKVGTASVFILNGQTKIITVDITPPLSGTQFRVINVTYSGYLW